MTQNEIIDMAKEARLYLPYWNEECDLKTDPPIGYTMVSPLAFLLEAFAKLVAAKEREDCAKVCENNAGIIDAPSAFINGPTNSATRKAQCFADAIRARGQA